MLWPFCAWSTRFSYVFYVVSVASMEFSFRPGLPTAVIYIYIYIYIYSLRWRYSPAWALASFTIRLQASRSLALSLHSFIPIFLRSVETSVNHLIFGLRLRLVAYSFPYIFFWNCGVFHSFYMTKPSYSLACNEPDNVLPLHYNF